MRRIPIQKLPAGQIGWAMPESGKRGYHHGNLRQALVDAALVLVVEKGPRGFTMAEAARRAEVSAAAPYRHFKGQEDILAEAARQGYLMFAEKLNVAYNDGKPDVRSAFEATGRAYLEFARAQPGHYICMFESGLNISGKAELSLAANSAMSVLVRAAEALSSHMPSHERPPATMIAHHIWAMSHGVVELFARNSPGTQSPFPPEDLLEPGIGVYLRGLGLIKPDDA